MEDNDERAKVLTEVQAQIVEDQPWSVLYWINQLTALSNDIGGLTPSRPGRISTGPRT